jgi:parvulin-like peptidyl-prolyl isomerase
MRNALREPLLHFLVLGLLLFLAFDWRGGRGAGGGRLVVTAGQVEHLAASFARARLRPPTEEELKGLVDEHVKEEIATREAMAAGLDQDDAIVRRRLRQKLEFLAEDAAEQASPAEAELQAWLDAHADELQVEPRVALRQVFLSPARRGARAAGDAARELARLRAAGPEGEVSGRGDATMLPGELPVTGIGEVARIFGGDFARAVDAAPVGEWSGPVGSGYGLHLVLVRERLPGGRPTLAEVRSQVEREVLAERRRRALDALYAGLLARYRVTIDRPAPRPAPTAERAR